MAGKFGKRTAFYRRFIISFGIFSIIYQMVLVWAIYLFHGVSGNTVRHYLIADLDQLEAAGTSPCPCGFLSDNDNRRPDMVNGR